MHRKGKWDLNPMQEKQSIYTTCLGDCPNVFLCFAVLWKEHCLENSRGYSILKQQWTLRVTTLLDFSKVIFSLSVLLLYSSSIFSSGQRGNFPGVYCYRLSPLSPACTEDVIFQGPKWRTEPSDLILPINSPDQHATITCEAEGSPPPQYR